jgi:hypothetical protein
MGREGRKKRWDIPDKHYVTWPAHVTTVVTKLTILAASKECEELKRALRNVAE